MSFDSDPNDSQLVCLLGDSDWGPIKAIEEAGLLTVRPWLFPMKCMTPWMIFVAILITCMTCFMPLNEPRLTSLFFWFFLSCLWLLALPGILVLLVVANRLRAKKGNYFKIDTAHRTLELCRTGRTINGSDIIAVTLLTRWYRCNSPWTKMFQTGLMIRAPQGRVELHPVIFESSENVPSCKKSTWADRLANTFQVPVRRIELNKSESRELNDCN